MQKAAGVPVEGKRASGKERMHKMHDSMTLAAGIPRELQERRQWVLWRHITRDGKSTKVPFKPDSTFAKADDPSTWSSFEVCQQVCQRDGYAGTGYEFSPDDPYCGIDLDGCRNPSTGELDPWAQAIVDRFPTYCEVSPSGTGVKLFARGKLPTKKTGKKTELPGDGYGKKKPGIEAYHHGRYFAMTGETLPGRETIIELDAADLDAWFNETFKPDYQPPQINGNSHHVDDRLALIERAKKYLAKVDPAISGRGGHDCTYHVASILRARFGLGEEESLDAIDEWNARCEPPWAEHELRHKLVDADKEPKTLDLVGDKRRKTKQRKKPAVPKTQAAESGQVDDADDVRTIDDLLPLTDLGNAMRLADRHGADIRYCFEHKAWYVWDGKRWKRDNTGEIYRRAKEAVRSIAQEADHMVEDKEHFTVLQFGLASQNAARIKAMIDLAKSEPGIAITTAEMDKNHFLLNCENGTIDLTTGQLGEHRREDFITKISPVEFDPNATCPTFTAFLDSIFGADDDLIGFVQRFFGYSATGDMREQIMAIFYGGGSNGKTTLLTVNEETLGEDYAMTAKQDFLMVKKNESHPTELADLHGKRLVIASETDSGKRLAESLVKDLTGNTKMRARGMKQDFWQFNMTHKLILCTNHKPIIRNTDYAIWRRIRLVPFTAEFTEENKDPDMLAKLRRECSGILNWIVSGCLAWQRDGLGAPLAITDATKSYHDESDIIGQFIAERVVSGENMKMRAKDLYAEYETWCGEIGDRPLGQRQFGIRMTERGYDRITNNGTWYVGVGLLAKTTAEPPKVPYELPDDAFT